jgi:hypothetical protein
MGIGAALSAALPAVSTSTLANASLGLTAAGAGMSVMGAYGKAGSTQAAYEYQAQVAQNNAIAAEWQAQDAITRGQVAEARQRMNTAQLKGTQRASLAARGLDLGEGSALNILTDTDYMGELDALTIRDNAAREAWGYRENAKGAMSDAAMMRMRASAESPAMAATGSLLSGATSVASSWYGLKNVGAIK